MGHLGRRMDAAIGATSGDHAGRTLRIKLSDRLFQHLLDAVGVVLSLPTEVGRTVVLQAERNAPKGPGGLWASGGAQTSSMIAISALSPRRGTVRMMRV